eukprot:gene25747-33626_t
MGSSSSSESSNRGKKVIESKLKSASKTGVLNLSNMDLKARSSVWSSLTIEPPGIALAIKTLDLSENTLKSMPREIYFMSNLKTLNLSKCNMQRTYPINVLQKLTSLRLSHNDLEIDLTDSNNSDRLAAIPISLVQVDISFNHYIQLPAALLPLANLAELNMSSIGHLVSLVELLLDDNCITEVPDEVVTLTKLRYISLRNNRISKGARQTISPALFVETTVVNIDLFGNPITKVDVMKFDGVEVFLERRKVQKDKSFSGGASSDHSLFGLD